MIATYRCIADTYLPGNIYASAGDLLSDAVGAAVPIPVGWQPPLSVDPIDAPAVNAFWAVGPRGQGDATPNQWDFPWGWFRWSNVGYAAAAHYWVPIGGGQFLLKGAENLGPKSPTI